MKPMAQEPSAVEASIVIPSYRRPGQLADTLRSCLAQTGVDGPVEIIVVDNDPAGSARETALAMAAHSAIPIRYVHEVRAGISHARNTGVANATGRYLVFIDDDEEAVPGWLAAFLAVMRRTDADLAVGPVYPKFPGVMQPVDDYRFAVYTRDAGVESGTELSRWGGIGNTILDKARCFGDDDCPFAPELGLSGGEDALFLRGLARRGRKLVWCAEAAVWETVPPGRLDPNYLLLRSFRGGQLTTFLHSAARPLEIGRIAWWMTVGLAQVLIFGPLGLALRVIQHRRWLPVLAKAASGLGKLLWPSRLQLNLYRR